jgi:hypothetical protein
LAKLGSKKFLVDVENRLFRNFRNSEEVIEMHSQKGRQMVKDMLGSEWDCHAVFTDSPDKAEV